MPTPDHNEHGEPMCLFCGAPNAYPYCSQECKECDQDDE